MISMMTMLVGDDQSIGANRAFLTRGMELIEWFITRSKLWIGVVALWVVVAMVIYHILLIDSFLGGGLFPKKIYIKCTRKGVNISEGIASVVLQRLNCS